MLEEHSRHEGNRRKQERHGNDDDLWIDHDDFPANREKG
jgi:hypothetical protein